MRHTPPAPHQPNVPIRYETEPEMELGILAVVANVGLIIPLIGIGIVAFLIRHGFLPWPEEALIVHFPMLMGVLIPLAISAALITGYRLYRKWKEHKALAAGLATPQEPLPLFELKRDLWNLSTTRWMSLDTAFLFGAGAGAAVALLICIFTGGHFLGNPVAVDLMLRNLSLSTIQWVGLGTVIGGVIGLLWRPMAYWMANLRGRDQDPTQHQPLPLRMNDAQQRAYPLRLHVRRWWLPTRHDVQGFVRVLTGAFSGLALAYAVNGIVPGGIAHLTYGLITAAVLSLAILDPFIRALILPHHLKPGEAPNAEENKRFWFEPNYQSDFPWYGRWFLGIAAGSAIGLLWAPMVAGYSALIGLGLAALSPVLFRLARAPLQQLRSFAAYQLTFYRSEREAPWYVLLFRETPHGFKTFASPWFVRIFPGSTCALLLGLAAHQLTGVSPLLIGLPIFIAVVMAPFSFACLRVWQTKATPHTKTRRLLDRWLTVYHTADRNSPMKAAYLQGYVRLVLGVLLGSMLGVALGGITGVDNLQSILTISCALIALVTHPLYKMFYPQKPEAARKPTAVAVAGKAGRPPYPFRRGSRVRQMAATPAGAVPAGSPQAGLGGSGVVRNPNPLLMAGSRSATTPLPR